MYFIDVLDKSFSAMNYFRINYYLSIISNTVQPRLSGQRWPPKISRRPDNRKSPDNKNQNGGRSQASERWQ